eukprot:2385208-Amphidinium_carterae.1
MSPCAAFVIACLPSTPLGFATHYPHVFGAFIPIHNLANCVLAAVTSNENTLARLRNRKLFSHSHHDAKFASFSSSNASFQSKELRGSELWPGNMGWAIDRNKVVSAKWPKSAEGFEVCLRRRHSLHIKTY